MDLRASRASKKCRSELQAPGMYLSCRLQVCMPIKRAKEGSELQAPGMSIKQAKRGGGVKASSARNVVWGYTLQLRPPKTGIIFVPWDPPSVLFVQYVCQYCHCKTSLLILYYYFIYFTLEFLPRRTRFIPPKDNLRRVCITFL